MVSPEEIKTKAARKYKDFLRYEIDLLLGESEEWSLRYRLHPKYRHDRFGSEDRR